MSLCFILTGLAEALTCSSPDPSMHVLTSARSQSQLIAPEFSLTGEGGEQFSSRRGLNHSVSPKGKLERAPTPLLMLSGIQPAVNCIWVIGSSSAPQIGGGPLSDCCRTQSTEQGWHRLD